MYYTIHAMRSSKGIHLYHEVDKVLYTKDLDINWA
jgi:hypothetical protein